MELHFFPWDNGDRPYWINPENGLEWYVDKSTTDWCTNKRVNDLPKLKAVVFIVAENKDGNVKPISRVLIDIKSNQVLADETNLEAMAVKIDMLRVCLNYDKAYKNEKN